MSVFLKMYGIHTFLRSGLEISFEFVPMMSQFANEVVGG